MMNEKKVSLNDLIEIIKSIDFEDFMVFCKPIDTYIKVARKDLIFFVTCSDYYKTDKTIKISICDTNILYIE